MRSRSRHAEVIDPGMLAARLRRLSGHGGPTLARMIGLPAGRLDAIANGRPPKPSEEKLLLMALRRFGGTLDGLIAGGRGLSG